MKILIFSDFQAHNWREFSQTLPNGRNSRFQDQLNALHEVFDAAKHDECDMIIHDGDLFESRADTIDKQVFLTVYNEFLEFSKENTPVVLNVGNHDWLDRTETSHIIQPFKEIPNIIVVDKPKKEAIGDAFFAFMPFTRYDFPNKVKSVVPGGSGFKTSFLFTHQGVSGAKTGPRDMNIRDEFHTEDFQWRSFTAVFNGHYHKAQKLTPNFYIIGSTIQKDFGERGEWKGYRILDTDTGAVTSHEITASPRFFKYEGNPSADGFFVPDQQGSPRPQDFVWVHSTVPADEKHIRGFFETPNVRLTVESQKKEIKPRSALNISMDVKTQLDMYIQVQKTKLNKKQLLDMGFDIYGRSV